MRLLIIEDEPNIRRSIRNLIDQIMPTKFEIDEAEGVEDGCDKIATFDPQIVLLDIRMKDGSGFDLLEKNKKRAFELIFLTAYDTHAIEAFQENAIQYLLKPVSPNLLESALKQAVSKIDDAVQLAHYRRGEYSGSPGRKLTLPSAEGASFLEEASIIYVEASGNYFNVILENEAKPFLVSKQLHFFESRMNKNRFLRIHRSFIINVNKIESYVKADGGFAKMSNGHLVPISAKYKQAFLNMVNIT